MRIKDRRRKLDGPVLKKQLIILAFKTVFCALIIYLLLFRLFGFVRVESNMMKPNVRGGDLVLYYRPVASFDAGDVVVYEHDGQTLVGRIIARGGDVVDVNGRTFMINGAPDSTTYYGDNEIPNDGVSYPYTLGEGQVFVVGDNRSEVADSRLQGGIFKYEVKGKVIGVFRSHAF